MVHLASISQQHYISSLIISWVSHHLQELNLEIQVKLWPSVTTAESQVSYPKLPQILQHQNAHTGVLVSPFPLQKPTQ